MVTTNFYYKLCFQNQNTYYYVMDWEQIVDFWKFKREYEINIIRKWDYERTKFFYYEIKHPVRIDLDKTSEDGIWIVKSEWLSNFKPLEKLESFFTAELSSLGFISTIDFLRNHNLITTENLRNELMGEK